MVNDEQEIPNEKNEEPDVPWAWIKAVFRILIKPQPSEGEQPIQLPVSILPWLYLSDEENSVQNIEKLVNMRITHVLTTNGKSKQKFKLISEQLQRVGIIHMTIPAQDTLDYNLLDLHWEDCQTFLKQVRDRQPQGKVVVHCSSGVNRSGLIVAAAMLTLDDESNTATVLDVVNNLQAKCGKILTNLSFQKQLCELASREGRLGDQPAGYTNDPL